MSRPGSLVAAGVAAVLLVPGPATAQPPVTLTGTVVYVDDGDTIDVRIGDRIERVRYIGIDAPEMPHAERDGRPRRPGTPGGRQATRLNRALAAARTVSLELDVETRDRYGRLLAYVWAGDTMINAEMVHRGYARALAIPPNLRHAARFAALESQARATGRGLWSGGGGRAPALRAPRRPVAVEQRSPVRCARDGAPVSYVVSATRSAAPPTEGRLWRPLRISHSTPSTARKRASCSSPASRPWSACRSISIAPTAVAG